MGCPKCKGKIGTIINPQEKTCKTGCLKCNHIIDKDPATILAEMAETFKERGKVYGDNYLNTGKVMMDLFPNGFEVETLEDSNRLCIIVMIVTKLTRFANSGMKHRDSIHDISVYGAMLESLL